MKNGNITHILTLIIAIVIPLAVGGISTLLVSDQMKVYHFLNKPALAPPSWLFPVAWTILYVLMGLASYFIITSSADKKTKIIALIFYAAQLLFNFFWSILFFSVQDYLFAFIWLIIMWLLVIASTISFFRISMVAGWLMIPYIAWATFAAYLNLAIYILSITPMPLHK